ncbi:MAG: sugar phosphate nucleotidyltransferase [Actinomycetota bacterium]|nr:sugar phosphate nucleotidyltransferase [Actinomycetota bacterium]
MQCVILAGGLGSRLRARAPSLPKPLVPVAGKPFVEYQVELLRAGGVRDLLLLVGHRGDAIVEHLGDGRAHGVAIDYAWDERPVGTAVALRNARPKLDTRFLLLNGDTFFPIDLGRFLGAWDDRAAAVLVAATTRAVPSAAPNLAVDDDGLVTGYGSSERATYVHAGLAAVAASALDDLAGATHGSIEERLFPPLIARTALRAYRTDQVFHDIGTPVGLDAFEGRVRADTTLGASA